MTEEVGKKVCEGTVADLMKDKIEKQTVITLTRKNAYRVKKIREQGTDEEAVLFHFRKRCTGMGSYVHTIETADGETELHPNEFEKWEAVEFLYPGYLEDLLDAAYNAYRWSSFEPEAMAETDIMQYEKQLVEDLKQIPEEKQNEYVSAYHSKFSAFLGSLSRCASPMVTGPAKFNCQRNNKALDAYQNRFDEFHDWRNRFKASKERMKEAAKPEEQKQEEAWNRLKRDIASSAQTIHDIDTGKAKGYSRALFVSSILNKVSTYAGKGEVEIVQKAVDFITDFNAQCKKPVITPRNRFFQLPEMARQARLKLQEIRERENRKLKFEGGMLVWNYEADRLQILFDSIPDDQRRKELKSYGFKWSPRYQAWQRQLTQNAIYAVKRVFNLQNHKIKDYETTDYRKYQQACGNPGTGYRNTYADRQRYHAYRYDCNALAHRRNRRISFHSSSTDCQDSIYLFHCRTPVFLTNKTNRYENKYMYIFRSCHAGCMATERTYQTGQKTSAQYS